MPPDKGLGPETPEDLPVSPRLLPKDGGRRGLIRGAALALFLIAPAAFAGVSPSQGDAVSNIATVTADGFEPVSSPAATIKVRIPSPPRSGLPPYAPRSPSATPEQVAPGAYLAGSPSGPVVNLPMPDPVPTGLI